MRRQIGFVFSFVLLLTLGAKTQSRTIDWSVRILSPDSGYLFESPGSDKVKFSLTNLGPDTIYPFDYHYTRVLLGASYFDPMITKAFTQSVYPGDSITLTYEFDLNFSLSKNNVPLCVSSRLVTTHHRKILDEKDGHGNWSNNEHCLRVDHKVKKTNNTASIHRRDRDIVVYPNPVQNTLIFEAEDPIKSIRVYDFTGRQHIAVYSPAQSYVDVSQLGAGSYVVHFETDNATVIKKIIKF
jgi:hypothetical protein